MRNVFVFLLFSSFSIAQNVQLDEKAFFSSIKNSYYSISSSDLDNFTCLITNSGIEEFGQQNWDNPEVFPLQFIWINPDRVFLSQQGVPKLDAEKQSVFDQKVADLKQQVKAILLDLQRFYITGIYSSISEDYILVKKKQVVEIFFDVMEDSISTRFKYTFGMNGLCLKIETVYEGQNRIITTYPSFKVIKTKWLCEGWEVQIIENEDVISGFAVALNNNFVDNVWIPTDISLEVQKKDEPGKTYVDKLKFRNYLFNQSLQLLDQPNSNP